MTDAQLIAIVKFLVRLQAENLALRKTLIQTHQIDPSGLEAMIAEQHQHLERLGIVESALRRNDLSTLSVLLDTLSAVRPQ
jgi:hypothetical protein